MITAGNLFAGLPEPSAGEQHHPFVPVLVVPEARRTRLRMRDDSLDSQGLTFEQLLRLLGGTLDSRGGE